jgi:hypothetical protein
MVVGPQYLKPQMPTIQTKNLTARGLSWQRPIATQPELASALFAQLRGTIMTGMSHVQQGDLSRKGQGDGEDLGWEPWEFHKRLILQFSLAPCHDLIMLSRADINALLTCTTAYISHTTA